MRLALGDVRVIEYGNLISAPYCSKLLADMGAEVIKIEKPGPGDAARRRGPFLKDIPGHERSGLFLYLNTNKQGVTLNIEQATGREIFRKLIKNADILIEDTKPGKLAALGLGYKHLKAINPSLIMTSITPFGQTGPYKKYRGTDLTAWHMGGIGYVTPHWAGTTEQEPLRIMQTGSFVTGTHAAIATMCALQVQRRTGLGQQVDTSQLEAMVITLGYLGTYWPFEHRSTSRGSRSDFAPMHFLQCQDGWVITTCPREYHWQRWVKMMGNPEWAETELFKDRVSRGDNWESLGPLMTEWTRQYTKAEIFELAKAHKIPLAPANTVAEVVKNRQLAEHGFFIKVEHPETGQLTYPGAPYKFARTPWAVRRPAPLLGQHNEEIYCNQLGYSKEELTKMAETGVI